MFECTLIGSDHKPLTVLIAQSSCIYLVLDIRSDVQQSLTLNCSSSEQTNCRYASVHVVDDDLDESTMSTIDCGGGGYS